MTQTKMPIQATLNIFWHCCRMPASDGSTMVVYSSLHLKVVGSSTVTAVTWRGNNKRNCSLKGPKNYVVVFLLKIATATATATATAPATATVRNCYFFCPCPFHCQKIVTSSTPAPTLALAPTLAPAPASGPAFIAAKLTVTVTTRKLRNVNLISKIFSGERFKKLLFVVNAAFLSFETSKLWALICIICR